MKGMRKKDFEDEPDEREIKANITKKARRIKKECFFQAAIQSTMTLSHKTMHLTEFLMLLKR